MAWIVCDETGSDYGQDRGATESRDHDAADDGSGDLWVAESEHHGRNRAPRAETIADRHEPEDGISLRDARGLGDADDAGSHSPWDDAVWLPCLDGKARRVEPSIRPLVDGSAFAVGSGGPLEGKSRVGMLRAYGNGVVPQVAAAVVQAYLAIRHA
jgi:hypothetical protein